MKRLITIIALALATLATALILLTWRTRWHWPALVLLPAFALTVGVARIYLGVHYPSDILAGWTAASVWTVGCFFLVFRHDRHPWETRRVPQDAG